MIYAYPTFHRASRRPGRPRRGPLMGTGPWWASLTTWLVVNLVNLAQAAGFASRLRRGMAVNHVLGYLIAVLAVPATAALVGFVRAGSGWWVGPALFDAFVVLMLVVDYVRPVEFRQPRRTSILVPYLGLFFGSILGMGLEMFQVNRSLWLVTVATALVLLGTMGMAMRRGAALRPTRVGRARRQESPPSGIRHHEPRRAAQRSSIMTSMR